MSRKFIFLAFAFVFPSFFSSTLAAKALTFETLPIAQHSKQWSVQIGEAEKGKDYLQSEKGRFNTYSLKIDKIGKDVDSVKVDLYRNDPASNTKYSLISCPPTAPCNKENQERSLTLARQMNKGYPYLFSNFPLTEKATELEVEVVWTANGEGRPMKETFIFTDK